MILELKSNMANAKIDSMGAQLISLTDREEREYIWQRDPKVWASCSPLLFPVIGNCRNGRTIMEGASCEIPKHGYCQSSDFKVIHKTGDSVTFGFDDSYVPASGYPYKFEFLASYRLSGNQLTLSLQVANRDDKTIYYSIGTHPGFRCPIRDGERFEDYSLVFDREIGCGYRRYDLAALQFDMSRDYPFPGTGCKLPLSHPLFRYDALWFDRPESKEVSLIHNETGRGIKISYDSYETVAFWTKTSEDSSFVCVEPWNGSAICSDEDDEFIHKNHLQKLDRNASQSYEIVLQII